MPWRGMDRVSESVARQLDELENPLIETNMNGNNFLKTITWRNSCNIAIFFNCMERSVGHDFDMERSVGHAFDMERSVGHDF